MDTTGYLERDTLLEPLWEQQKLEYRKTHNCMSERINTRFLEYYLHDIRDSTPRDPSESIDSWLARTWKMAVELTEQERPPLPRVVRQRERSAKLLAEQEKRGIVPEKENE